MRFSFISNGIVWQKFVSRLFVADKDRKQSPVKGFKTISSERMRDFGIDGIAPNGTVFQMYYPLWEPGEPRYKRVNDKLNDTCKILDNNVEEIKKIIGENISRLILIIQEDPDVKIIEHKQKTEKMVSYKVEIWGETEIGELLGRHPNAVKDFLPFPVDSINVKDILEEAGKLHRKGNLRKARDYYGKTEILCLINKDFVSRCKAKAGLAGIAYEMSELLRAKEYGEEALNIAKSNDLECLPRILGLLAQIELTMGESKRGENLLDEALLHANKQKDLELIDEIEMFQGKLALERGHIEKARTLFDKSYNRLIDRGGILLVMILEFKSHLARKEDDTDAAIQFIEKAVEEAEKGGFSLAAGKALMQLAKLYLSQKLFEETLKTLKKAESCFDKSGNIKDYLVSKIYIAKTLLSKKKNYEAEAILSSIIDDAHQEKLYSISGEANLLLAKISAHSKNWGKAINYFETAYKDFVWERQLIGQIEALLLMWKTAEKAMQLTGLIDMQNKADKARSRIMSHLQQAKDDDLPTELAMEILAQDARSMERRGKFEEVNIPLKIMSVNKDFLSNIKQRKFAQSFITTSTNRCREKIRIRDLLRNVKDKNQPLEMAQTQSAKTIQEAHKIVYSDLLKWMDAWPEFRCELLDFWGRGNYIRLLLNHQAIEKGQLEEALTLCVEVQTVNQARLACRILYPIVDCLILIWKGMIREGFVIVPQHESYEGPGGWGYYTCAGDIIDKEGVGNWHPALGFARLMPKEIVDFIFVEARPFVERGRLIIIPAALVGCEYCNHGYFEKLLIQELLNASPIISEVSQDNFAMEKFPIVVPYFPEIPLFELAKVVDECQDVLLETRIAYLRWGDEVRKEGGILSTHKKHIISTQIRGAFSKIDSMFQKIKGKMPSYSPFDKVDERISASTINVQTTTFPLPPESIPSSGLYSALQKDVLPWYPFWQLQSNIGGHWKIAGPKLPVTHQEKMPLEALIFPVPKTSTHWIQPLEGGWVIPTMRMPDI